MLQYLTCPLPNGGLLVIPTAIVDILEEYKQKESFQKEKGGIFLGRQRGNSIEVVEATTPQKGDKNGRFFFHRLSHIHQNIATDRWLKSNSCITFCGEWHTHPEKKPIPSQQDIVEWKRKLRAYNFPLLLIIIGQETNWMGVLFSGKITPVLFTLSKEKSSSIKY